jgi:hypothetical protein
MHDRHRHLGIGVLDGLIFYIYIFRPRTLANPVTVLPVFGAVLGDMDTVKNLTAPGVLAFLFAQFLPAPRFG